MFRSAIKSLALALFIAVLATSAFANSGELLTFQGLGNLQAVGNFYNGGGLSSTPNWGVSFSSNFFGLVSDNPSFGGAGNFSPFTLPDGSVTSGRALFIMGATGASVRGVMNVANGFSTGINFFFTAGFQPGQTGTMQIWGGVDGSGPLLATIYLSNNNGSCTTVSYCNWSNIGATFLGTAHSVTFTGPADELGLTQMTLGAGTTAIPEPSSILFLGLGLVALSLQARRFARR